MNGAPTKSSVSGWSASAATSMPITGDAAVFHTLFMTPDVVGVASAPLASPKLDVIPASTFSTMLDAALMSSEPQPQDMVLPSLWSALPSPPAPVSSFPALPSSSPASSVPSRTTHPIPSASSSPAQHQQQLSSHAAAPTQVAKTEPLYQGDAAVIYLQEGAGSEGDSDPSVRGRNTDPTNLQRRQKDQLRRRKMHQLYEDMDIEIRRFKTKKRATVSAMAANNAINGESKDASSLALAASPHSERTTARRRAGILGSALHTIRELQMELDKTKAELQIRPSVSQAVASSYASHPPPRSAALNLPKVPLLLEHATVMMVLREARNNTIVDVNNCFIKASGYTKAEVVGRTITDVQYATARATNFPDGMRLVAEVHQVDQDALDVLVNRRMAAVSTVKYFLSANGVLLKVFTTQYAIYGEPNPDDANKPAERQPQYFMCQGYLVD